IKLPSAGAHVCTRAFDESAASHGVLSRHFPRAPAADLRLHVSTSAGSGPGPRGTPRKSMDRGRAKYGSHVRGASVDVAGVGALRMGVIGSDAAVFSNWSVQLLDEQLLGRRGGMSGGRVGDGRATSDSKTAASKRCDMDGLRNSDSGEQPSV